MRNRWREVLLVVLGVVTLAGLFLLSPPIAQDPAYHGFIDGRALFGVPHFLNVASNLPFLFVGWRGLLWATCQPALPSRQSWRVMFAAVMLVTFGSVWYHLAPDNASLAWDRLPMAMAFMALFVALLNEYVDSRIERWLLWPLVVLGLASVVAWQASDDLRLYVWVQFFPLLALLLVAVLFPVSRARRAGLALALALYALGKVAEWQDAELFRLTGELLSGHTLKHLLAAASVYAIYRLLRATAPAPAC